MSKNNKFSVNLEPGECLVVMPTIWAKHVIETYGVIAVSSAADRYDANAYHEFIDLVKDWVEETAVEPHE